MQYKLAKEDFTRFLESCRRSHQLIAPVRGRDIRFEVIDDTSKIYLDENTTFPLKYYFLAKKEVLFRFKGNDLEPVKIKTKRQIFFGVRRCDLSGIKNQDIVFLEENADPYYQARRRNTLLFGLHCKRGDDFCFCNSVELKGDYDLMFYDKGSSYAIEAGSDAGEAFAKKNGFLAEGKSLISEKDRKIINTKRLNSTDIEDLYPNRKWEEGSDRCLSCGACNLLCPNCHCFSIKDEVGFDLKTGARFRVPAPCQLKSFTRVAGGEIFRHTRAGRFKHRIYHQIQYFYERHGTMFCTGCGRCIEGCPARIDWVEMINQMKK
ncbi:MAG: 4Fe-4S dicluster domain-containing protein [archaeon]